MPRYYATFKCVLPEECRNCGSEDYVVDGFYQDSESMFETVTVKCLACDEYRGSDFIIRHATIIAEKAEPYAAIRQDYIDHILEMERER
jgi:hypothetical protein